MVMFLSGPPAFSLPLQICGERSSTVSFYLCSSKGQFPKSNAAFFTLIFCDFF